MPKVLVVINTFNRWFTLGLVLSYLEHIKFRFPVFVFDGGSRDKDHIYFFDTIKHPKFRIPPTIYGGNFSCGNTRKECLELLLKKMKVDHDFIFMTDDDILFNNETIESALSDFQSLGSMRKMGSFSPFTFLSEGQVMAKDGVTYRELLRGGEAHVLLHRGILEEVGINFGPFYRGFGDIHWEVQKQKGYSHVARCNPVKNIQHFGIADGVALERKYVPFWIKDLYLVPGTNRRIPVDGFDVDRFTESILKFGCMQSCMEGMSGKFFL